MAWCRGKEGRKGEGKHKGTKRKRRKWIGGDLFPSEISGGIPGISLIIDKSLQRVVLVIVSNISSLTVNHCN